MNRRTFLLNLVALPLLPSMLKHLPKTALGKRSRVRPGDASWPKAGDWDRLRERVGGRLVTVTSPLEGCKTADKATVDQVFKSMGNPYYIGDEAGLTQSTGLIDGWVTRPSAYAIAANSVEDVAAGVDFARENNLRLVVKGGGHSYHGTSCAPDSLLIWTHAMRDIDLHDAFIPSGCEGRVAPQAAVTVGAGCLWMHVYQEVSVKNGKYVQGGGCGTVGVAGLVQSGGFGSFSKNFGTAAANLLEAEIVTADGKILTVNAKNHPDLFWALKGGGGGSWGVVTKLTLKTHDLPKTLGGVSGKVQVKSDAALRRLLDRFLRHYRETLFNPHWGESVRITGGNTVEFSMELQGLSQAEGEAAWRPFVEWIKARHDDYEMGDLLVAALPGRSYWDGQFWKGFYPSNVAFDDRPGAPKENVLWAGDAGQCGIYWHGYESVWLQQDLLRDENVGRLVDALTSAALWWTVEIHFNKGIAGAPDSAVQATRDTAMNPAVLDAFALAIIAGGEGPCYEGVAGHEPNKERATRRAGNIREAMVELRKVVPSPGSYVSESSFFEKDWRHAYWGKNYDRLLDVKRKYDPDGLFYVHHGVGSEGWSANGFVWNGQG